ncbi:hypothetical protein GQ44DRAFT_831837 [Phaeosphaeriaceae sp. PMI808]|nr:hypothetical protein GQ44DRAFT_831837 [Phaeosphaeriaceae sp. PMI808]
MVGIRGGAIDIISQLHNGCLAPVWGLLRAVITTVGLLLERLVELLKRFTTYENIFRGNVPLRHAIGSLYCNLIDFCSRAVKFYGKTSVRTIFGSFDRESREILDNIRYSWTEIDIAANFVHITESKKIRAAEDERRMIQIRGDIQRWLYPANVSDDLHRCVAEYMPNSCIWFRDLDAFKAILCNVYQASALRIVGRPGEGKTMLASSIINYLVAQPQWRTLYFFCTAGNAEKRLAVHAMRTLLSQFLHLDKQAYGPVEKQYHQSGRGEADCFTKICSIFRTVLRRTVGVPIFIIVDAIDECAEAEEFIKALRECMSASPAPIHLIVTSRDHVNLRPIFEFSRDLTFPSEKAQQPIREYVTKRVSAMTFLSKTDLASGLVDAVSKASDGLWLYARLLLDEISQASSISEVHTLLNRLPEDIMALYTSVLRSAESRFSDVQIRIAQEIFIWIDGADYMPWWHFHSNDVLEDSVLTLLVTFANGGEAVFDTARLIEKLCFPIVSIVESNGLGLINTFAARFVHFSAEQYLHWSSTPPSRTLPKVLRHRRLRRLRRGVTAAWYYTRSEEFKTVLQLLREDPYGNGVGSYFEMAYGMGDSWHASRLPPDLDEDDLAQIPELCKPLVQYITTADCLGWAEAAILINYAGGFTNLLENVEKAVHICSEVMHDDTIPAWHAYVCARDTFFRDFVYVLKITGPGYKSIESQTAEMPEGFMSRDVAVGLLHLGKQYNHFVDEAPILTGLSGESEPANNGSREWSRRRSSTVSSEKTATLGASPA